MSPPRLPRLVPRVRASLLIAALLLLAIAVFDVLVDGPLRRIIERRMNERLHGYSVALQAVDLSPWTLSLDLFDLIVVQQAHPRPPVAGFPRVTFSVQWRSLLSGRIVGDARLQAPRLYVNLQQLREERADPVALDERGWQDAVRAAYPLEINELRVVGGSLVYSHRDPDRPLRLSGIELLAANIRNIESPERRYPSPIRGTARVFEDGRLAFSGQADFLAEPHAGMRARLRLEDVPLEGLDPLSRQVRLFITGGRLSAAGELEYAPRRRAVHLSEVEIAGVRIDYLFDPELTERALEAAWEVERDPKIAYRLDLVRIVDGELGFVNRGREPGYRLFLSDAGIRLTNLSSRSEEVSELRIEGRFMGSGETVVNGAFRPDRDGADFDVGMAIRGTELAAMNDLLRSYAKVDVHDGIFSFYSEVSVADGTLEGYVKPLFQDVDVYDREQDRHKGFFRRIWERIVEGLSELLENRPRDEVATIAELSGSAEDPEASNLQVILNLIRNAFFEAILPGFEKEAKARS